MFRFRLDLLPKLTYRADHNGIFVSYAASDDTVSLDHFLRGEPEEVNRTWFPSHLIRWLSTTFCRLDQGLDRDRQRLACAQVSSSVFPLVSQWFNTFAVESMQVSNYDPPRLSWRVCQASRIVGTLTSRTRRISLFCGWDL